jgi:hypothetical protein
LVFQKELGNHPTHNKSVITAVQEYNIIITGSIVSHVNIIITGSIVSHDRGHVRCHHGGSRRHILSQLSYTTEDMVLALGRVYRAGNCTDEHSAARHKRSTSPPAKIRISSRGTSPMGRPWSTLPMATIIQTRVVTVVVTVVRSTMFRVIAPVVFIINRGRRRIPILNLHDAGAYQISQPR